MRESDFFVKNSSSYVENLVRDFDNDRYVLSMFLPADVREDVWAILAFNHEIAKTREVVSESTLGLIRLQWWRDSISEIYEGQGVKEHEVLRPLADAIERHALPREEFDNLAYAREFDLEDVLPGNIEGLLNYCEFTTAPLLRLIIQITGGDPAQEIVQPVAMNYGLAGVLRATRDFASKRRFYFPEDLVRKYNFDMEAIFEDSDVVSIVREIVDAQLPLSKPSHIFLRGCEALSEVYFKQIISLNCNVMDPKLKLDPSFKMLRVFWKTKGVSFW